MVSYGQIGQNLPRVRKQLIPEPVMRYAAALTTMLQQAAETHLIRSDGQEDLCFGLWYPGNGESRVTSLVESLILPRHGDRDVHGNVSFTAEYFERALGVALAAEAGLCFMHSHPAPGWQGMSSDDVNTERSIAPAVCAATGLPLLGMTVGTDGAWSARRWEKTGPRQFERVWCDRVRVAGDYLAITYHPRLAPAPLPEEALERTISAWGPGVQADLSRLTVGIVGAGSVGSIIGEALARMGFREVHLIDFDSVEEINLDRILHATRSTIGMAKVEMLASAYTKTASDKAFSCNAVEYSVVEKEGFQAALDCDLLFSCVDRPWARSVLNAIAFLHLIPVIDGGIRAQPTPHMKGLRRADFRAHVVTPGRACLECLGQYDSSLVGLEREGFLDNPSYIAELPPDHVARQKQNVFAFSLHTSALQLGQMISLVARPLGISDPGATIYHLVTNTLETGHTSCKPTCLFRSLTARGSSYDSAFIARHLTAEQEREKRNKLRLTEAVKLREPSRRKLLPEVSRALASVKRWLQGRS